MLLAYTDTEYEDKRYTIGGTAPDYTFGEWQNDKFNLGLDFPNLPYYIDGDVKITQSSAVLRYIARKNNLCGTTDEAKMIVDMIEHTIIDFRKKFTSDLCYNPDFDKLVDGYKKDVVGRLESLEKYLGDKKYFAGELTFVDFMMYEFLDQHKIFDKTLLEPHKKLMAFVDRIEALPAIAAYKKSDKYIERPINNVMASFK